jgi:hypothetical protein
VKRHGTKAVLEGFLPAWCSLRAAGIPLLSGLHARQLDARIEVHLSKRATHGGQFAGIDFPNIQLIGVVAGAQRYALVVRSVNNLPQQHSLIAFQVSVE